MTDTAPHAAAFDCAVQPLADAGVFAQVTRTDLGVRCDAMHLEETCYYSAWSKPDGTVWVGWYSPDRWLSGSIEGDLVHTGDKIDELLEEELVDQGVNVTIKLDHFRNEDKLFVFHGELELPSDPGRATDLIVKTLLAFQACFVELGDMAPDEED